MQRPRDLPLIATLAIAHRLMEEELFACLRDAGYTELRPAHACVFSGITTAGERLTVLAERADMTKQAVGEVVSELEGIGYVERVPDPSDGRAKIIRLTERGHDSWQLGFSILAEIQSRWESRYGTDRVRGMEALLAELVADEQDELAAPRAAA